MEEQTFEKVWGISEQEVEELRNKAREQLKNTKHTWRQKGAWLECRSCEQSHGVYLGTQKMMVGEKDDGTPILVHRDGGKNK